jgi:hypothetical protein
VQTDALDLGPVDQSIEPVRDRAGVHRAAVHTQSRQGARRARSTSTGWAVDERQEGCAAIPEISYCKDDGSIQAARFAIPPKSSS